FIGEGFHKRIDLRKNTVLFRRVLLKKSGDWRKGVETARRQRDWSRPACNEDKWLHEADECDGAQQKTRPPAGGCDPPPLPNNHQGQERECGFPSDIGGV